MCVFNTTCRLLFSCVLIIQKGELPPEEAKEAMFRRVEQAAVNSLHPAEQEAYSGAAYLRQVGLKLLVHEALSY
jgi:hypothetical protein